MVTSKLWQESNYNNRDIDFIYSGSIYEYDMSKANISVLREAGYLSQDQYDYFYNAPREVREIAIGKMELKDRKVTELKKEGIKEARRKLFEYNNILDYEVLSIKNDAVFIIGRSLQHTKFGFVDFKEKNKYCSFMRINTCGMRYEMLYSLDQVRNYENLDIKGLGKDKQILHKNYFIEFLYVIFESLQLDKIEETVSMFNAFYEKYIKRELDPGYYRSFDYVSGYIVASGCSSVFSYAIPVCTKENVKDIDISCNLQVLRVIQSYINSILIGTVKSRSR